MPALAAMTGAAKAAGRRLLVSLAADAARPSDSPSPVAAAAVTVAALVVLSAYALVSAPMGLWGMAADFLGGAFGDGLEGGVYGLVDDVPDEQMVKWYVGRAEALEDYARSRWTSGTGEDVYSTPDWRYLCAFDMAVSENDHELVRERFDYYDSLHESLLKARSSVKYRYKPADADTQGAVYSEEDGRWYVVDAYTIWSVTYKPLKSALKGSPAGELTDEFKYFAEYESAEYGAGWGDVGNALGYYQFDRRYNIAPFLAWLCARDPGKWAMLEPWAGASSIAQGDSALEAAWMRAYGSDPAAFAAAQDRYEYENMYLPAEEYLLAERGVDMRGRRECVKGLVCGMYNLFGPGGWKRFTLGLSDSMSDEDMARALCGAVISGRPDYANSYRAELQDVLALLSRPAQEAGPSGPAAVGSDPSAEGGLFPLEAKAALAENYRRALLAVTVGEGPLGGLQIGYDHAAFVGAVTSATLDGAPPDGNPDVVNATMSRLGCPYVWAAAGPDAFYCSGLVTWAYAQAGVEVPHYTGAQIDACEIVGESEARPGDLVFQLFGGGTNAVAGVPGHVGIYIGDGQMIHAPTFGAVVRVDDVRVFDPDPVFARLAL